jgi:hypothetical protein
MSILEEPMQYNVRFNRFEETVPDYIAEHRKPSYNHPSDGHGPTSTQKRKPRAMYTQHAERGIETTVKIAETSNQRRHKDKSCLCG